LKSLEHAKSPSTLKPPTDADLAAADAKMQERS